MQRSHQTHPAVSLGHKAMWATFEYTPHWARRPIRIPQYVAEAYQKTVEDT